MNIEIKPFIALSVAEIYALLRLRADIFVVEQTCIYQDIDDKDQSAHHLLATKDDRLIGYARMFGPGDYFDECAIGRVCVDIQYRGYDYGYSIMNAAIAFLTHQYSASTIKISAQSYLVSFYQQLGFTAYGAEYLEDGIPHQAMQWFSENYS